MESWTQKINREALPPMLRVYLDYKQRYSDTLLFFQVGDFYELFFEDAVITSKAIGLTLTSRDKSSENPIPMCGFPIGVVDSYLDKLVSRGYSVAVVKQASDPSAKKGMVDRELERIVTPGVRVMAAESKPKEEIYVAALFVSPLGEEFALAYTDVRTGTIVVREALQRENLLAELRFLSPAEIVLSVDHYGKKVDRRTGWVKEVESVLNTAGQIKFRETERSGSRTLIQINGFTSLSELSKKCTKLLINYIDETMVDAAVEFTAINRDSYEQDLVMDASTRKHLELLSNVRDGSSYGTLLSVLDQTVTAQGGRKLRQWILRPSKVLTEISKRQDAVAELLKNKDLRASLQGNLSAVSDLERITTRIELGVAMPNELAALRDSLLKLKLVKEILAESDITSNYIAHIKESLACPDPLLQKLQITLADSPPYSINECGVIRQGVDPELDRLTDIRTNGKSWIADLEREERENTGITSLKIRFNNVFGYFIEVTKANLDKVPDNYIRKQTMVNAERFITPELKKYEDDILSAESKQIHLEKRIYQELLIFTKDYCKNVRIIGDAAALLDLLISLAEVAERDNLIRPIIVEEKIIQIEQGKHPVLVKELENNFTPNDLLMNPEDANVLIITGPNMGGKSTYLRQAALIVIMAQLGSYVPAHRARIGLVDKIFTRIGASDNMLEGESTFMVEMRESAFILANATPSSLLLVDELGRGTATQDGLSIAQATLEWIVERLQARTLFATHFHELTQLEGVLSGVKNLSVGSKDINGEILFTHTICNGAANKSYGLEVARIAGLPQELLLRARQIMADMPEPMHNRLAEKQLSIFNSEPLIKKVEKVVEPIDYKSLKDLKVKLDSVQVDTLTPLQALNILADLVQDK